MELQKFIQLFAEQFEETGIDSFTPVTVYKELVEWDSLTALSVISMIDEEMNKTITADILRSCDTIEDLFNLIKSK